MSKRTIMMEQIVNLLKSTGVYTDLMIKEITDNLLNTAKLIQQRVSEGIEPDSIPKEELDKALGLSELEGIDLAVQVEAMKLFCYAIMATSDEDPKNEDPDEELVKFINHVCHEDVIHEMMNNDKTFAEKFFQFCEMVDDPLLAKYHQLACILSIVKTVAWDMEEKFVDSTLVTEAINKMQYNALMGKRVLLFVANYCINNDINKISDLKKSSIGNTEVINVVRFSEESSDLEILFRDVSLIANNALKDTYENPDEGYEKIIILMKRDLDDKSNEIDRVTANMTENEDLISTMYVNDLVRAFADDVLSGAKTNYGSKTFSVECIGYAANKYGEYASRSIVIRSLLNTVIDFLNDDKGPLTLSIFKEKLTTKLMDEIEY